MTVDQTLQERLEELEYMGYTPRQRDEAMKLLGVAQERGDQDLEFAVRMILTANGVMRDQADQALANFAWCAAKHKEDPARFFGEEYSPSDQIFWHYKWMPGIIANSAVFDLEQLEAVLQDFEDTYRAAGLPLSAVVTARLESAINVGDLEGAKKYAAQLETMPRDDFSSCEACVPADFVDLEMLIDNEEAAVRRAVESWRAHNTCAEEPETMLAGVLVPMLRLGHPDALEAYETVYDASKGGEDKLGNLSECALFASVTGNHELAFSILERNLRLLVHDALRDRDHFGGLINFAVVLDRLAAAFPHLSDAVVRGSADPRLAALLPATDQPRSVTELSAVMWQVAKEIGDRFDARNGNDMFAKELAKARALVTEEHPIELPAPEGFSPISVRPSTPQSAADWLERAIDSLWAVDGDGALAAVRSALADIDSLDSEERVRAAAVLISCLEMGDAQDARDGWALYVDEVHRAYGEEAGALAAALATATTVDDFEAAIAAHPQVGSPVGVRARLLAMRALFADPAGPSEENIARAIAVTEEALALVPDDEPMSRASVVQSLARLRFMAQDIDGALALVDSVLNSGITRAARAGILEMAGGILVRVDQPQEAAQTFDEAASLFAAAGFDRAALYRGLDAAQAWRGAGDEAAAAARFEFALSLLQPDEGTPTALRWDYGMALLNSGDAGRAIPQLESVLADELAAGDVAPESLASTYFQLARAYDNDYDERAAEHYLRASELFARAEFYRPAADAALFAGRELSYQDEYVAAREALETARGYEARDPDSTLEAHIGLALAPVLSELGDDAWRAVSEAAIAAAIAAEDVELRMRGLSTRMSLLAENDPAGAAAEGPGAIDQALANDEAGLAVGLIWLAARATGDVEGVPAGVNLLNRYRDRVDEFGEERSDLADMGAELLRQWNLDAEAQQWLAAVGSN